jgi:integrase
MADNLKSASIRLAVASIQSIHKLNQVTDPTQNPAVKLELKRMHRALGRSSKKALGITEALLEKMLKNIKSDLRGARDRALMLLAYDSLCRRSELAALRTEDIEYDNTGSPAHLRICKSKTDQEGAGKIIKPSLAAQEALNKWLNNAKITEGYIFRGIKNNAAVLQHISPGQINRIYNKYANSIGLTDIKIKKISGHSFRIGAAIDMMNKGVSLPQIMIQGRWKKYETTLSYLEGIDAESIFMP